MTGQERPSLPDMVEDIRRGGTRRDPYRPAFGTPITTWWRWFAWRPVETVDRGWVWLRVVWRRRIHKHQYLNGGADFWFQHAIDIERGERRGKEQS